ncbi:hypothetical protein [Siccirubricoccus sp. G192]|uniref:hypothetical protein n=1 Tax=Siccirubricoccus sp. G192 TaxID=2849651 RepID=UPI001C2C0E1B|nr:hypothetical protein [Siccirubricoccus sp. G192]MBV1799698.1 hypothetical protein [Siccirubricoccus sp. G192]
MNLDLRLQRVFDRVELVSGIGTPDLGQMCVMAFVAALAGEGHTDAPSCASQLIRAFAIPLNDHMPREARQRLKPFAPRILGTNDGLDAARAEVLRQVVAEEILPRTLEHRQAAPGAAAPQWRAGPLGRLWLRLCRRELHNRIARLLAQAGHDHRPGHADDLASAAGRLIGLCARSTTDAREAEWYWSRAIGLLDRLCDVGAERRREPEVRADRLERFEAILDGRRPGSGTHAVAPPALRLF